MANKKQRVWYIDKLQRMGIVEKVTNAITKDGYTSDWESISEVKDLRIYAISRDLDLVKDNLTNTWSQIPAQFHEHIVTKAIAMGYKDPRNMQLDVAQYFDAEYLTGLKEAKKFSRSNYQTTGTIKPQDF
jgi:predicted transcriptional regulator|tara:strand:+ start:160 stop:549 length:390 start_codon:yes stop_codon:yes gene_type:complete